MSLIALGALVLVVLVLIFLAWFGNKTKTGRPGRE
jgi:hypothetical protein